jgi:uncharacterized Zn-finger protein
MYKCSKCNSQFYFKSHLKDHEDFKHPNRVAEPVCTSSEYGTPLGTATAARDRLRGLRNTADRISPINLSTALETCVPYQPDLFTQYWIEDTPIVCGDNTVA